MSVQRKQKSLRSNLRKLSVLPLLLLGLGVLIISTLGIYSVTSEETKESLSSMAHIFHSLVVQRGTGEFALSDGVLTRGGRPFSTDEEMVDQVYQVSGVDATIFYADERVLTSVRRSDGTRALGTRAAPEVTQAVLLRGEDYYSQRVQVNGVPYYGYYVPLRNGGDVVGMVFVGMTRSSVFSRVAHTFWALFLALALTICLSMFFSMRYAKGIVHALQKTKAFLGAVAQGDVEARLDPGLLKRNDELGEMARFSTILQKSITTLVGTDPLTGLYNRRSCGTILSNALEDCKRSGAGFTLAIGDIDDFKLINDHYGHQAGDAVLKELSALFLAQMRDKGFVSRWGGEEFLFLYERTSAEQAAACLNSFLQALYKTHIFYKDQVIPVSMTFGVAAYSPDLDLDGILRLADNRLYYGKQHGKNCVVSGGLCEASLSQCFDQIINED